MQPSRGRPGRPRPGSATRPASWPKPPPGLGPRPSAVRGTAPVEGESEIGGLTFTSQLAMIALVAGVIVLGTELASDDDDDAVSP